MDKKLPSQILDEKIYLLNEQQSLELLGIKNDLQDIRYSLRPMQILKNVLGDMTSTVSPSGTMVDSFIALGSGYLMNAVIAGKSKNVFFKLSGYFVQYVTTRYLADHMVSIRANFHKLLSSIKNSEEWNKEEK